MSMRVNQGVYSQLTIYLIWNAHCLIIFRIEFIALTSEEIVLKDEYLLYKIFFRYLTAFLFIYLHW